MKSYDNQAGQRQLRAAVSLLCKSSEGSFAIDVCDWGLNVKLSRRIVATTIPRVLTSGLFLFAVLLPGYLYGQSATSVPQTNFLNCTVCDSNLSHDNAGALPDLPPWSPPLNMSEAPSFPLARQDNRQNPQAQKNGHSPSATSGSPGHIFWVIPAFKVDYQNGFKPLTPREKFHEWARSSYDPLGLTVGAFEAGTLEYSSTDGFCGYGKDWGGYGKCFGSLELDANVSSFIGDYALTVLLHQDPRYFRLGEGSFGKRLSYAISRVFITHSDSGHATFYVSALSGTTIAAGLSNLYYPEQDRGFSHTLSRIGLDLGNTALYNAAAEFWPDINNGLHRMFGKR